MKNEQNENEALNKTDVMRSAFYTPKIEEFHVGFEYESFEIPISPSFAFENKPPEWIKRKVLDINNSEYKDKALYHVSINNRYEENVDWNKNIRVKYLDTKDFESLNFTREFSTISDVLKTGCEVYKNEILNVQIVHYKELNKISICTIDFSKNKIKSFWDENQINLIAVKNKSELQYILNRLGFLSS